MASVAAAMVPARAGKATRSRVLPAAMVAIGLALGGLFGRLMTYPLRHDEQMYLPIATMHLKRSEADLKRLSGGSAQRR